MPNRPSQSSRYNLRSGLVLYPSQQEKIEQILTKLTNQAPAQFVLLADVTGQVVSTRGSKADVDLVALGSLVAGDLAASQEIARLTGQYQDYQLILREGETSHTFICESGHHLALLVQISTQTPLGWARMVIQKAAKTVTEIATNPPPEAQTEQRPDDVDFGDDKLPDLFDEALDDLWLE